MNILEQLNLARNRGLDNIVKVTTIGDLPIGKTFEFASRRPLRVGSVVYICNPRDFAYGRAIITNNPSEGLYVARRTS